MSGNIWTDFGRPGRSCWPRRGWFALLAASLSIAAPAQDAAPILDSPPAVPARPAAVIDLTPKPVANSAPAKSPEEKRVEELLKLKFERNAAGILQAQATLAAAPPADVNAAETLRLRVVAGRWKEVGAFLKTLPEKDAVRVYEYVLKDLDRVPTAAPNQGQQMMGPTPAPTLLQQDIAELAELAPTPLNDASLKLLGALLRRALAGNGYSAPFLQRLESGLPNLGGSEPANRERAAQLLLDAGRDLDAVKFLPPLEVGRETASLPLLEKHVRCAFSQGKAEPKKKELTQRAWSLNQLLLTTAEAPAELRERAWKRTLEIAPFLAIEDAARWMQATFATDPQRGLTLLNTLAAQFARERTSQDPGQRRKNLELQRQVVTAMLPATAHRAQWQPAVNLFAANWLEEADYARRFYTAPRPQNQQFDEFGNRMFFGDEQPTINFDSNQLRPIPLPEVMPAAPSPEWLAALDPSLLPRTLATLVQSHLKLEEEAKALTYLEQLAPFQPKETLGFANELLRLWARLRDPQRDLPQRRSGMVYYSGGSGMQAQGVPLTRALQQRNLEGLAAVLGRLRKLPIGAPADEAIVAAFSAAHSPAEVFRPESIELVLGKLAQMKTETLAELLQTMRTRLATQWRKPSVQQQAKTQRTDAQIEAEILRGYELLGGLLEQALAQSQDDWRLHLAQACTAFDWAEFQYGKKVDLAIYVEKRERAFAAFQRAAELYAAAVPKLEPGGETPVIYQQWLNANLGASDLAFVTRQQEPSAKSLLRIREAVLALPGPAAERHLDALAKVVGESPASLPAHLKPAYMRAALAVVGEREAAREVRKLVEYYDGLLQEIALEVRVDGDSAVGHGRPFGVFFTVRHSAELERENAGGFGKYLRNQSQTPYYFNPYGTPAIDHRDNLEKQMREKLSEGFEILSITFHDDKVQSRGFGRAGWRETPLAYLLLKAKDASVDRLPPLRLDVDFIDKHGPVVLPVSSSVQLIDARPNQSPARPVAALEATQILDDRELATGQLNLEVKVTGQGLVPEFSELFEFSPAGFKIEEQTDSGPAVQRLDSTGPELVGASDRTWLLKLRAISGAAGQRPFKFPTAKTADLKVAYKRYQDADLSEVPAEVALAGLPLRPERLWLWSLLGVLIVAAPGWALFRLRRRLPAAAEAASYAVPADTTPFTTLQLLRQIASDARLNFLPTQQAALAREIAGIEDFYFARSHAGPAPDLHAISRAWVERTRPGLVTH